MTGRIPKLKDFIERAMARNNTSSITIAYMKITAEEQEALKQWFDVTPSQWGDSVTFKKKD